MAGVIKRASETDAVYIIEALGSEGEVMQGGGICIDPRGLMVTVAHIIPVHHDLITVRARSETDFGRAEVLDINYGFDICFLLIEKASENQRFGYVNLVDNSVREEDEVFSWIHHNIGFTLVTGKVSYPYENVVFPPWGCRRTIGANLSVLDQKRTYAFTRTLPFRTTGGITRRSDVGFHDLHPDLPLIEIHGFLAKVGSSGSPVFTSRDGTLIGLIMLYHSGRNYLLPTDFILGYISEYKISVASQKRKGVEVFGSSGNVSFQKPGKSSKKDRASFPKPAKHRELTAQSVGEMKAVAVMHQKKAEMVMQSDGLPGGYGTPEELLEIMTMAQLGIHDKPVGLFDVGGYYNSLLSFIDKAVEEGFISPDVRDIIVSMPTARQMVKKLGEYVQLGDGAEQLGYPRA